MKLTNPEKLTLFMLSEIYDKLGLDDVNTKLLRKAILSENLWALDWEMQGIVGSKSEDTPPDVSEVVNYLDMWSFLEEAYESFGAADKALVKKEAHPFGDPVRFSGFDGNNEGELISIADMLVGHMNRFQRFKGRDLNSHVTLRENYARMYQVFEPMRATLMNGGLSPAQVVKVMQAKRHPE